MSGSLRSHFVESIERRAADGLHHFHVEDEDKRERETSRMVDHDRHIFGTARAIWIAVGAIGLLLLVGAWVIRYRPELLSGDGTMTESGYWSYPRYTVAFPSVEIANDARAFFHVKGLPRDPMTFMLNSVPPANAKPIAAVDLVEEKDWTLTVRIRDDEEQEIYGVSARLSEWHTAQSVGDSYSWHTSLRDMNFSTRRDYTIEIRVSGPLDSSGLFLEPQLTGGGNEFP